MLTFNKPSFETLSEKEWLVTNGLGGYASSTISGANTRRYHGLLVASLRPPTERTVIVSKIEETLTDYCGKRTNLSSNQYHGAIHPTGHELITAFERKPFPTTTFEGDEFRLKKTVLMLHHSNTTLTRYKNSGKEIIELELNPFYVYRDYHHLFHEQNHFEFYREAQDDHVSVIYPYFGAPPIFVQCPQSVFVPETIWYKHFLYAKETERGLDDDEDACSIGAYHLILKPGQECFIVFTIDKDQLHQSWKNRFNKEKAEVRKRTKESEAPDSMNLDKKFRKFYRDLVVSGNQFIVKRSTNDGHTIIAGYHWFTDWGRDTMIAMRGLVIARHHQGLAKDIIRTFLSYMKDGLIPNRFPDHGEIPEYNTIDASLWLFIVMHEYDLKFGDKEFIEECLPKLKEVLQAYRDGTKFNIHMTNEGLISGGEDKSQLTWMDAKVGDYVVTPRHGCPVEINALWYNALRIYDEFLTKYNVEEKGWNSIAVQTKKAFRKYFLNKNGYLNDVVIPGESTDDAFRPNQVYALSLPYSMLTDKESKGILNQIAEKLLTPYGLRSLSMDHPDFIPIYTGDQWHRDRAYHQGTVWAYLMGEYLLAYLKINKYTAESKQYVLEMMSGLMDHFYHADCIHGISEIFDGGNPGHGKGCIHQAWSVGMLLSVFDSMQEVSS